MNSFLLNRAQGTISPSAFHVAQTSRLVQLLEPAPGIRFTSHKPVSGERKAEGDESNPRPVKEVFAHKAGVNVLTIDQHEGR
jgi:DNA excision repair protein ERCC-8